jgi:cytosolic 5'-nucleotidase 3
MTKEEKTPFMIEWWTKTFELIIDSQISRENLIEIVRNSTTHLKDGCQWLFHTLERCEIPLLIFSAGLGDIIQEWIIQQCGSFKNMKIVSNFMSFDYNSNIITGFQGNMIHIFNKNEGVLLDTEYEKQIENRHNVILLGNFLRYMRILLMNILFYSSN